MDDVVSYLKYARRHARMIAFGVALCIFAPYANSVLESVLKVGAPRVVSDVVSDAVFFSCIAAAVALFIIAAGQSKRYGKVHKDAIFLDGGASMEMEMSSDEWAGKRTACTVVGVLFIIMGPISSSFSDLFPGFVGEIISSTVLLFVAIGVAFLVYAGSVSERHKELAKGCKRAAKMSQGSEAAGQSAAGENAGQAAGGPEMAAAAPAGTHGKAYEYEPKKTMPTWLLVLIIVMGFLVINTGFNIFRGFRIFSGMGGFHLLGPIKTSHYEGSKSIDFDSSLDKVKIELKQSDLTIEAVDGDELIVSYNGDFYGEPKVEKNGKELSIKEESGFQIFGFHFGGDDGKIKVGVPKKTLASFEMEISAGDVNVEGAGALEVDKMQVDMSAGKLTMSGFKANSMDLDMATGDLSIDSVTCTGEAIFDLSTGSVLVTKSDLYRVDADLSMGGFTYELPEPKKDYADKYDVDLDVSLGDIEFLDEKSNDDLSHDARKSSDEKRSFSVDCSMGSIQIR